MSVEENKLQLFSNSVSFKHGPPKIMITGQSSNKEHCLTLLPYPEWEKHGYRFFGMFSNTNIKDIITSINEKYPFIKNDMKKKEERVGVAIITNKSICITSTGEQYEESRVGYYWIKISFKNKKKDIDIKCVEGKLIQ
jgi:hypothetical protein